MDSKEFVPAPSAGSGTIPLFESRGSAAHAQEHAWHVLARWIGAGGLGLTALLAHHLKYVDTVSQLVAIALAVALYNLVFVLSPFPRMSSRTATFVVLILDVLAIITFFHFS